MNKFAIPKAKTVKKIKHDNMIHALLVKRTKGKTVKKKTYIVIII